MRVNKKLTFKPIQKVCSLFPHGLAPFVSSKCREATDATKEESSPPDKSTPNGTSDISLLITDCKFVNNVMMT